MPLNNGFHFDLVPFTSPCCFILSCHQFVQFNIGPFRPRYIIFVLVVYMNCNSSKKAKKLLVSIPSQCNWLSISIDIDLIDAKFHILMIYHHLEAYQSLSILPGIKKSTTTRPIRKFELTLLKTLQWIQWISSDALIHSVTVAHVWIYLWLRCSS